MNESQRTFSFEDLIVVATVESYEVVNNDYCQYTIHVGLANGNVVPWTVVRRFSDFDALHWALMPLGPPWSEHELPPKRRWVFWDKHNPEFLEERHRLLQELLNSLLSNPMPPAPLRQFLEVEAHVDLEEMESMVQYGNAVMGGDGISPATQEEYRLKMIVEQAAMALIDVTRDNGDDILELDVVSDRRDALLRDMTEALRRQHASAARRQPEDKLDGTKTGHTARTGRKLPVVSATFAMGDVSFASRARSNCFDCSHMPSSSFARFRVCVCVCVCVCVFVFFFFFQYASSGLIYASIFGPPPASNNTHNRVRSSLWWIPSHELQTCLQRTRRGSLAFMA